MLNSIKLSTIHPTLDGTLYFHGDGTWLWWKTSATGLSLHSGGKRRRRVAAHPRNVHPRSPHKRSV